MKLLQGYFIYSFGIIDNFVACIQKSSVIFGYYVLTLFDEIMQFDVLPEKVEQVQPNRPPPVVNKPSPKLQTDPTPTTDDFPGISA